MIIVNDLEKNLELDRVALADVAGGRYLSKEFYKESHYRGRRKHRRPSFIFIVLKPYSPKYFKGYGCHYTPKKQENYYPSYW